MKENFKLDDFTILSFGWWNETIDYSISLGDDGVTRIDSVEQYLGDYSIIWIQVWKKDKITARYNACNVDFIEYKE